MRSWSLALLRQDDAIHAVRRWRGVTITDRHRALSTQVIRSCARCTPMPAALDGHKVSSDAASQCLGNGAARRSAGCCQRPNTHLTAVVAATSNTGCPRTPLSAPCLPTPHSNQGLRPQLSIAGLPPPSHRGDHTRTERPRLGCVQAVPSRSDVQSPPDTTGHNKEQTSRLEPVSRPTTAGTASRLGEVGYHVAMSRMRRVVSAQVPPRT
jgi:hypothetical protein